MSEQQLNTSPRGVEPIIDRSPSMTAEQIAIKAEERLAALQKQMAVELLRRQDEAMVGTFYAARLLEEFQKVSDPEDRHNLVEGRICTIENFKFPKLQINKLAVKTIQGLRLAQFSCYGIEMQELDEAIIHRSTLIADREIGNDDKRIQELTDRSNETMGRALILTDSLAKTRAIFSDEQRRECRQVAITALRHGILDSSMDIKTKMNLIKQFDALVLPVDDDIAIERLPMESTTNTAKAAPVDEMHALRIAKVVAVDQVQLHGTGRRHAA